MASTVEVGRFDLQDWFDSCVNELKQVIDQADPWNDCGKVVIDYLFHSYMTCNGPLCEYQRFGDGNSTMYMMTYASYKVLKNIDDVNFVFSQYSLKGHLKALVFMVKNDHLADDGDVIHLLFGVDPVYIVEGKVAILWYLEASTRSHFNSTKQLIENEFLDWANQYLLYKDNSNPQQCLEKIKWTVYHDNAAALEILFQSLTIESLD